MSQPKFMLFFTFDLEQKMAGFLLDLKQKKHYCTSSLPTNNTAGFEVFSTGEQTIKPLLHSLCLVYVLYR
ncbi:hypothetical protein [Thalassomonas actiniarum]|uniref:hypothetical protein n=1 Tax=Thalassomonas actiniarum TaxID=485447 RepID=UPI0005EA04F3|nr:hypothetical protein [Thalassomonas actiniarum]